MVFSRNKSLYKKLSLILIFITLSLSSIMILTSSSYEYHYDHYYLITYKYPSVLDAIIPSNIQKPSISFVDSSRNIINAYVILSIYTWLPNGSFVCLGKCFYNGSGEVFLDRGVFDVYARSWIEWAHKYNNDPRGFKSSIVIMATIHTPRGVYLEARSVPIDHNKIIAGAIPRIEIPIDLNKEPDIKTHNSKSVGLSGSVASSDNLISRADLITTPPAYISEGCGPYYGGCYVWVLMDYYYTSNDKIAYVSGLWYPQDCNVLNSILLKYYFYRSSSNSIDVYLGAKFAKHIGGEVGFDFSVFGKSFEFNTQYIASSPDGVNSGSVEKTYWCNKLVSGVAAIGFKAESILARYYLRYYAMNGSVIEYPYNISYLTLSRPKIVNNLIQPWYSDPITDSQDLLEIYKLLYEYEKSSLKYSRGAISVDILEYSSDYITHISVDWSVVSIGLMKIAKTLLSRFVSGFTFMLGPTVGYSTKLTTIIYAEVYIALTDQYQDRDIEGVYYYSKLYAVNILSPTQYYNLRSIFLLASFPGGSDRIF